MTGSPRSRRPRARFLLLLKDPGSMSLHLPRCCSSRTQYVPKLTQDNKRASYALSRAPLNCRVSCLLAQPHSALMSKLVLPNVHHKVMCLCVVRCSICCEPLILRDSAVLRSTCHARLSIVHIGRHVQQSSGLPDSASMHVRSFAQYAPCVTLGKNALLIKFWYRV